MSGRKPSPIQDRFLSKVEIDRDTGCWNWTGAKSRGYGVFQTRNMTTRSHRLSYMMFVGDVPDDYLVLHSCDNRSCVNPMHLRIGTSKENQVEMARKGRGRRSSSGNPFGCRFRNGKWEVAVLGDDGKISYLGRYSCEQDAVCIALEFKHARQSFSS